MFTAKPGFAADFCHHIETGDAAPASCRLRPMSDVRRVHFDKCFQDLLDQKLIEMSTQPWASPPVMVRQPDGLFRLTIDFCKLNAATEPDRYPLPLIADILAHLGNAKYFTNLDLSSGFWQIPLSETDRAKTAFIMHEGLFEFNHMPMGLRIAGATFQKAMNEQNFGSGILETLLSVFG